MKSLRNFRFYVLLFLVLLSVYSLIGPFLNKQNGVKIIGIANSALCTNVNVGDDISQVGGAVVSNVNEFENSVKNTKAGEYVVMVINGGPGGCIAIDDGNLGLEVSDKKPTGLMFGSDIRDSTIIKLKPVNEIPQKELSDIVEIMNRRINALNIPDTSAQRSDDSIVITGLYDVTQKLLKPCKFEVSVVEPIDLYNNSAIVKIGEEHKIVIESDGILIDGTNYNKNSTFLLENIEYKILNVTNDTLLLSSTFITNNDIESVLVRFSSVTYKPEYKSYLLTIPLELSQNVSPRFQKIVSDIPTVFSGTELILKANLVYSLDGKIINRLSIPKHFADQKIETLSIVALDDSSKNLLKMKSELESCLSSGEINASFSIDNVGKAVPKYRNVGTYFLAATVIGVLLPSLFFIKKNVKTALRLLLLTVAEILMIFGAIAFTQQTMEYGWIIGLPTVLGILFYVSFTCFSDIFLFWYSGKRSFGKLMKLLTYVVFLFSFIVLFTNWKFLGLTIILGISISTVLTRPMKNL